ncbi:ribosome biogenesis protein SLX9 homolog isoform X2 [Rhinolophus ferrumequinum]|uniref:ribosome biogenesis protein SLX9 homolog isoform X2 n=1 Tax=Rhinolophus ferrumequinum TaxID=59479 RepID=UPI00140F772B|nr:ribosome biogenesis protein SLX9 homolog isoform X2 [Rhinolophus ferrumequinum]
MHQRALPEPPQAAPRLLPTQGGSWSGWESGLAALGGGSCPGRGTPRPLGPPTPSVPGGDQGPVPRPTSACRRGPRLWAHLSYSVPGLVHSSSPQLGPSEPRFSHLRSGTRHGLTDRKVPSARPGPRWASVTGAETKAVLPKKEKRKLRRERWLQKIEAIKLAEQKRQAERKRRATVVVGDLQPLRDALPELLELEAGARRPHARRASSVPRPAELSRMSAAQRLQLLEEERTRFRELLASPIYRASPLLAIGQQLAQRMQLDGGGLL